MKRAPIVISGTVVGLVGLFSFHSKAVTLNLSSLSAGASSSGTSPGTSSTGSSSTGTSPKGTVSGSGTPTTSTTTPPTSTTSPTTTTQPTANSSSSGTPSTTTPPTTIAPTTTTTPPTTTTAPPSATRSATGPVVNYYFGTVSISVTASGKKITNIGVASLNDGGNPRSQQIDQYALPQLIQQALAANSANIQGISGATYTSQGFAQSLQSALSKIGL